MNETGYTLIMERQFEYRIKYKHASDIVTNYHYYMCESASQALEFQNEMIEHHNWRINLLSVERKNPWSNRWEDESDILTTTTQLTNDE